MAQSVSIGREQSNDIVLPWSQVSSRHALITLVDREQKLFRLEDLGSTNGTFKNGERVRSTDFGLGDSISIANVELKPAQYVGFFFESSAEPADAPKPSPRDVAPAKILDTGDGEAKERPRTRGAGRSFGREATIFGLGAALTLLGLIILYPFPSYLPAPPLGASFPTSRADTLFSMVGYVLVATVLLLSLLSVLKSGQRLVYERRQRALDLELWASRLETVKLRHLAEERLQQGWNGYRKFEISRKQRECESICSFYLRPHDGRPIPSFKPGQYLTFSLDIEGHEKPVVRCYSLSDSPHLTDRYRVTIKRLPPPPDKPDAPPGLSSYYFHDKLQEGDILNVKAPSGHFFLDEESATPVVLVGGGVGVTPVLSMLNAIAEKSPSREAWFFYGVRNSAEHIFPDHLKAVARDNRNLHLQVCYSHPLEGDVPGEDYQHGERVSVELFKRLLPSNNYDFYICGPAPMMDSIVNGLEAWGVPTDKIHFEAFGPATVKRVYHEPQAEAAEKEALEVHFVKSGKRCQWTPGSGSLLELAEANGISVDYGCRAGNCGTCIVAIRDGGVDYLSEPGFEPEEGSCLACIARPREKLALDA